MEVHRTPRVCAQPPCCTPGVLQVSKEVAKLRDYEQTLLKMYQVRMVVYCTYRVQAHMEWGVCMDSVLFMQRSVWLGHA